MLLQIEKAISFADGEMQLTYLEGASFTRYKRIAAITSPCWGKRRTRTVLNVWYAILRRWSEAAPAWGSRWESENADRPGSRVDPGQACVH